MNYFDTSNIDDLISILLCTTVICEMINASIILPAQGYESMTFESVLIGESEIQSL